MTREQVLHIVKTAISEIAELAPEQVAWECDASLDDAYGIGSTQLIELILLLEEKLAILIDQTEIEPEDLQSINSLVAFLCRVQAAENL
ncbi:phosphopantetheine-binding protein [Brevibacillus fulvus]|uniref:Acyl carrier protein n=1 Tax=Brevibacillus fulvus TaxID=1125967 RepID=A0A938XXW4_9BACL|nr:phosphopantetheine-binding protein [Brevibacillus fulvus]MBM7589663.1 acyl carrier protein [Brevibacillus fulvus]